MDMEDMLGGMAMNLLLTEAQAATGAVVSPVVWILYFAALIGIFYFFGHLNAVDGPTKIESSRIYIRARD